MLVDAKPVGKGGNCDVNQQEREVMGIGSIPFW